MYKRAFTAPAEDLALTLMFIEVINVVLVYERVLRMVLE